MYIYTHTNHYTSYLVMMYLLMINPKVIIHPENKYITRNLYIYTYVSISIISISISISIPANICIYIYVYIHIPSDI